MKILVACILLLASIAPGAAQQSSVTINNLPPVTTPAGTDDFLVYQPGLTNPTRHETLDQVKGYIIVSANALYQPKVTITGLSKFDGIGNANAAVQADLTTLIGGYYLTPSAAASTYQPIGSYQTASSNLTSWSAVTPSSYLTVSAAASTYQPIGSYQTLSANLTSWSAVAPSSYETVSAAAAAFQPISSNLSLWAGVAPSSYLTTSAAASTYQPIGSYQPLTSNLTLWSAVAPSSYLTTSAAASTYQPIGSYQPLTSNLTLWSAVAPSSYETVSAAAAAFQPISSNLSLWAGVAPSSYLTTSAAGTTYALQATLINGHALSSNVTISASDLLSGTLAIARLPSGMNGTGLSEASAGVLSVNTTQNITKDTAFSSAGFVTTASDGTLFVDTTNYLSISVAGSTYLSQFNASTTYVPLTRTINGHALNSNLVLTASDLTSGTLPIAQVPTGTSSTTVPLGNDPRFPATVSGIRKSTSTGSTDVAAIAGTDYVVPSGSVANFTGSLAGDVTGAQGTTTIAANAVTNAKAAQMPANTVKANIGGSTANASDVTLSSFCTWLEGTLNGVYASITGNNAFTGVNTGANQTAASSSSYMTRGLVDTRYIQTFLAEVQSTGTWGPSSSSNGGAVSSGEYYLINSNSTASATVFANPWSVLTTNPGSGAYLDFSKPFTILSVCTVAYAAPVNNTLYFACGGGSLSSVPSPTQQCEGWKYSGAQWTPYYYDTSLHTGTAVTAPDPLTSGVQGVKVVLMLVHVPGTGLALYTRAKTPSSLTWNYVGTTGSPGTGINNNSYTIGIVNNGTAEHTGIYDYGNYFIDQSGF